MNRTNVANIHPGMMILCKVTEYGMFFGHLTAPDVNVPDTSVEKCTDVALVVSAQSSRTVKKKGKKQLSKTDWYTFEFLVNGKHKQSKFHEYDFLSVIRGDEGE